MDIREYLANNRLITDGAMGTWYDRLTGYKGKLAERANWMICSRSETFHRAYIVVEMLAARPCRPIEQVKRGITHGLFLARSRFGAVVHVDPENSLDFQRLLLAFGILEGIAGHAGRESPPAGGADR